MVVLVAAPLTPMFPRMSVITVFVLFIYPDVDSPSPLFPEAHHRDC